MEYLSHIKDLRLILIGQFDPPEIEQKLKDLPGYTFIYLLGWLSWTEAWKIAQDANAGLILFHPAPNHKRSMPNKLFEYMAAGLPVIASNFPLWRQIVEGNSCGLCVDPLKPEEIAQAIEYLLAHPAEAYRMGQNGRRVIEEKYNWENEGKELINLYQKLVGKCNS